MPSAAGLAQIYGDDGLGPVGGGGNNHKITAAIEYNNQGYDLPEKVLTLDPKIGRTHTTFYAQADPVGGGGKNGEATAAIKFDNKGYPAPEKVHVLDPKIARTHTTFYA